MRPIGTGCRLGSPPEGDLSWRPLSAAASGIGRARPPRFRAAQVLAERPRLRECEVCGLKILHLTYGHINNPWLCGGGSIRSHEINRRLAKQHQVTVACGAWPDAKGTETIDGVRYEHIGFGHSYVASRLSYVGRAMAFCRRRRWDLVVEDFSAFTPLFAGWRPGAPTMAVVHELQVDHLRRSHGLLGRLASVHTRVSMGTHRYFIAVSDSAAGQVRQLASRIKSMVTVHNGVDASLHRLAPTEGRRILFLGRHEPYMKGIDLLFDAYGLVREQVRDVSLTVAGFGDPRASHQMAASRGLNGSVSILANISEAEKRDLLSSCLTVVMPSRHEGWGIVAIEAAACGKPVIGTRVPGLVDSVRDGETGILVPAEDVDALARAICTVIEDDALRHRLGAAGREWAREFSWDRAAEEQEAFYRQVIEAESGQP
ncbi:MAG: glycosyltransferase [Armatimonadia bacterium]|nr:glycosyltransferase [Armatimonadia bacterium]